MKLKKELKYFMDLDPEVSADKINDWLYDGMFDAIEIIEELTGYDYDWQNNMFKKNILSFEDLSSGEQYIVFYIFLILSMNANNTIVMIDEPEIGLSPIWQKRLLKIFKEISILRDIQFIFTTHSSLFIVPENIEKVIRISSKYQNKEIKNDGDNVNIFLKNTMSFQPRNIKNNLQQYLKNYMQIIKSENNEKIFFSKAVILVEGITDYLFVERLMRNQLHNEIDSLEIINVKGKENFIYYIIILNNFQILYFLIADLDFFKEGLSTVLNKAEDKTSSERNILKNTIIYGSKKIGDLYNEVNSQLKKGEKISLEDNNMKKIYTFLYDQGIFILREGDIETYLPYNYQNRGDKMFNMINFLSQCFRKDEFDEAFYDNDTTILNIIKQASHKKGSELEEIAQRIKKLL